MNYDHFSNSWSLSLQLKPGEYFYKFLVDNEWVCSDEFDKEMDQYGNINNYLLIE